MVGIRIAVVSTVGITVRSITVIMSIVSISLWLSISGPLAVVVAMVGIGVAVVAMVSVPVSVVGQSIAVVMAIVGISLSLGLGFSVGSDGCEKAESGNSNRFHLGL